MSPALGATGPAAARAPRYWCPGAPLRCAHPPPPTHEGRNTNRDRDKDTEYTLMLNIKMRGTTTNTVFLSPCSSALWEGAAMAGQVRWALHTGGCNQSSPWTPPAGVAGKINLNTNTWHLSRQSIHTYCRDSGYNAQLNGPLMTTV